jgi:hypothetical protein
VASSKLLNVISKRVDWNRRYLVSVRRIRCEQVEISGENPGVIEAIGAVSLLVRRFLPHMGENHGENRGVEPAGYDWLCQLRILADQTL